MPTCSKPNVKGAPINFMVYKAVSVHIRIVSFALMAPIILVPSCNLCVPAALTAEGAKVLMSS